MAVDATGNLFISDSLNDRIRKVAAYGIIATVAGNGTYGWSGDGGVATNAEFNQPQGIAVSAAGNMFIADWGNNVIRNVNTNGIITTVAGNGYGAPYSAGYYGDGGAATNALLNDPIGVAVDAKGNLFIVDSGNNVIRKVVFNSSVLGPTLELNNVGFVNSGAYDVVVSSPYGSVTSTVVNLTITPLPQVTTTALPSGADGVAYSQTLAASGGQIPYSWTNISGVLPPGLTLATNGVISGIPTTNGTFNFTVKVTDALSATATQPLTLTVGSAPSVAIQPTNNSVTITVGNNVTFVVSVAGNGPFSYQWQLNGTNLPNGIITTVAGNGYGAVYRYGSYAGDGGAATNAELAFPFGVTVDTTGNLLIADWGNGRIRKVGNNGIITTVVGNGANGYSGNGGAATNAELNYPEGVALDAAGNLFIADNDNNVIRKVENNGIITTVAGNGTDGYSGDGGAATNAELNYPGGVAVDATGNLLIADWGNGRIRKVGNNGIIATVAGNGISGYFGDGGTATNAELNYPGGVAVDATGNLFIADESNKRIRKVAANGIITTVAGNGTRGYSGDGGVATNAELNYPIGVALDATGNLFIADTFNNVIRKVGTNGIITTVAGNGYTDWNGYGGFSGDGGAATNAELWYPSGVALDATGNLFIADESNNRIRKVVNPGIPGPTLVLNHVGFGNAGAYDVVVSNPYGSVTSSVVNLTVTAPVTVPGITSVSLSGANLVLNGINGQSGGTYYVLMSTNLTLPLSQWIPVGTNVLSVSGNFAITATNTVTPGIRQRFYILQTQ